MKKRKPLKLTKEQKKALYKKPESNYGVGWTARKDKYEDPRILEHGVREDD